MAPETPSSRHAFLTCRPFSTRFNVGTIWLSMNLFLCILGLVSVSLARDFWLRLDPDYGELTRGQGFLVWLGPSSADVRDAAAVDGKRARGVLAHLFGVAQQQRLHHQPLNAANEQRGGGSGVELRV